MKKEWKPYPLDNKYIISNDGEVYSEKTKKMLTARLDSYGYKKVGIMLHGKYRNISIHRLVAETFVGGRDINKIQVNHIDGNKENNSTENLEWVTPQENIAHSVKVLGNHFFGTNNGGSKLDEMQVLTIFSFKHHKHFRGENIASVFGVSKGTTAAVIKGVAWAHMNKFSFKIEELDRERNFFVKKRKVSELSEGEAILDKDLLDAITQENGRISKKLVCKLIIPKVKALQKENLELREALSRRQNE